MIGPYDPHCGEYTFLAPPLGVWRLAGVLQSAGVAARVFDPNCTLLPPQRALERELLSGSWDIVGVSTTGMTLRFDLELAHIVRLHPSTITGVVQRLVSRGLLERERDPRDGRRVRLRLNAKAFRYTRITSGTVEHAVKQALTKSGRRRVTAAREVLAEIAESLNEC